MFVATLILLSQGSSFYWQPEEIRPVQGWSTLSRTRPETPNPHNLIPSLPDTYNWNIADSALMQLMIPPGGRAVIMGDTVIKRLVNWDVPDWALTPLALRAVDAAPDWLKDEMADNLSNLSPELQDTYALYVLNCPDQRYLDELCFQIAHVGPEILSHQDFDPEMLLENVRFLYQLDDTLDYVRVIDVPGPDYYSTTVYRMVDLNGDTVDYEIDPYYYYYYIVHPEMSDEMPRMDWYVYNRCWRDFYAFYTDASYYPLLVDTLARAQVVWSVVDSAVILPADRPFDDTACALNVINNWVIKTVNFNAQGNRPIQPNVIVKEHDGNCGERQDALAAAGRTGLIPLTSICTLPEDHVWNEFYLNDQWYPYQADLGNTHINDSSIAYDAGKQITSAFEWRSDGKGDTHTRNYSKVCSLSVYVYDRDTTPIEGARVLIYGQWNTNPRYISCWGFTDDSGLAEFELGDSTILMMRVQTDIGDWPTAYDTVSLGADPGDHFYLQVYIDSLLPQPRPSQYEPDDSVGVLRFDVSVENLRSVHHGYAKARTGCNDHTGFYHHYTEKHDTGRVSLFLIDSANYALYEQGSAFQAFYAINDITGGSYQLLAPRTSRQWFLLISNEKRTTTTQFFDLGLKLWYNGEISVNEQDSKQSLVFSATPNPGSVINIRFSAPWDVPTSLALFDASGRQTENLFTGLGDGKVHRAVLKDTKPGVYFLRLKQGRKTWSRKIVVK